MNQNKLTDGNTATDLITNCIIGAAEQGITRVKSNMRRP